MDSDEIYPFGNWTGLLLFSRRLDGDERKKKKSLLLLFFLLSIGRYFMQKS